MLQRVGGGVHLGNELVKRDDQGKYHAVDDTAIANGDEAGASRWKYARSNAGEHFAEVYAMAVETPDLLYHDYIEEPVAKVGELSALVHDQQQALGGMAPNAPEHAALAANLAANTKQLAHWQKAATQRKELFEIVRNDVFHAEKHIKEVVARMQSRHATADQIQDFQTKAAKLSTPKQIDAVEREIMP